MKILRLVMFVGWGMFFLSSSLVAEEMKVPEKTQEVLHYVYDVLKKEASQYPGLRSLGARALTSDQDGWAMIDHWQRGSGQKEFRVYVKALPREARDPREDVPGHVVVEHPKDPIKFVVFVEGGRDQLRRQLIQLVQTALQEAIAQGGVEFPIRFSVHPAKDVFRKDEKLEFELIVENSSKVHLHVQEISARSTFCQFNDFAWGTKDPKETKMVILAPGKELRKKLRFVAPQSGPMNVFCSYGVGTKGLRPSARTKVTVQE